MNMNYMTKTRNVITNEISSTPIINTIKRPK
jgi:hypothetical protein